MSEIKQGYKQTKVGIIPEDWEVVKIKEATSYVDYRGKTPIKTGKGIFLVTAKNIKQGFIDYEASSEFVSEVEYHEIMKRGMPKIGDILITTEAPLGNVAQIDKENIALAQRVIKFRSKKNVKNDFLKHYFLSNRFQSYLYRMAIGTTVLGIQGKELHNMSIVLPPLKEQEKIAQILTTWDEAITKQTELLEAKELLKKALMQKLLSGEVRFSGFSDEWEEARLDKLVFFQEGPGVRNTQYRKSGVKLLNVGNLNNNTLNLSSTETYISEEEAYGAYKHFLIDEGDLLISCSGINSESFKKKIAFAKKEDLPLCMNTSTMRFKNLKNKLLLEYLYFFFQTLFFEKQVFGVLTGSAQFNFGPTHIKWFKIKLPTLPEQQKIAEVLSVADDEINQLKSELEELKLQKKALMQQLLTGQVRVKV
ncbi:Restriction modification system DNA specificity domain [Sulfurimonas denitrificans DSM 1251]|uniref:Restriction modification system DNA specificity domain n=1 Tax=Sulfurimonas denitrificans (strain ATCC 33889 / DSM 1251) TaxID=326298 RepID=Q30S09_SULDN|nr:restriction endonuclease subunit S [Sulfurimonas denitrificans]ABB44222.1 Restriction modification system DNA specificity domain [Sulfurimonas denitrificans DSM 1251]